MVDMARIARLEIHKPMGEMSPEELIAYLIIAYMAPLNALKLPTETHDRARKGYSDVLEEIGRRLGASNAEVLRQAVETAKMVRGDGNGRVS